ncbi:uncharacterized protein LOC132544067 [Ylistrum balloti]|uniref:uncharacterized protein LOC132544067 n=1 Tax=Ylistrum balloti TaxID=509963 RepID=UPI002905A484|nr:uncharacterized protein LOC132544067 [Ylistrum balloti]
MAKGGGEKTYFVGTIKKTDEPSRSLAHDLNREAITYANEQTTDDTERENEGSPSGGSKKVRFLEKQNDTEQSSKSPNSTSLKAGNASFVKSSSSRTSSRNTVNGTPRKRVSSDSGFSKSGSPTKSVGNISRASITSSQLGSNGTNSASVAIPQSAGSQLTETGSQFKFYANDDVTPDAHSLISPSSKRIEKSLPSATSSSKRSDDFRFHAGYDDDFEEEDEKPKKTQSGAFAASETKQ